MRDASLQGIVLSAIASFCRTRKGDCLDSAADADVATGGSYVTSASPSRPERRKDTSGDKTAW